jgi:glutamine synthetase adenylyltransferase
MWQVDDHDRRMRGGSGPRVLSKGQLKIMSQYYEEIGRIWAARDKAVTEARAEGKSESDIQAIFEWWKPLFPKRPEFYVLPGRTARGAC